VRGIDYSPEDLYRLTTRIEAAIRLALSY
jgi:hypothetical protein